MFIILDSTLTFTGIYLDECNELRYVAIDDKTQKREVFALGGNYYKY